MKNRFDVFVSSTSKDLYIYREQVRNLLVQRQLQPIMMEDFPAVSRDATELCKQKVQEADVFIGIYAKRYGYCPKDSDKSITEMEFEWAKQAKLSTLIFVLNPDSKLEASNPIEVYADTLGDSPSAEEKRQKLNDFLGRIGPTLVWKTFETPDQLARYTGESVDAWLKEHQSHDVRSSFLTAGLTFFSALLSLGLLVWTARSFLLAQYLPQTIAITIVTLLLLALPFALFRRGKQSEWTRIAWLLSSFLIFLVLRPILYQNLAETSLMSALTAPVLQEAQTHLNAAQTLGMDSQSRLLGIVEASISDPNSEDTNPHVIRAAELLSPDTLSPEFFSSIENQIRGAISNGNGNLALVSGQVLAYLAPDKAASLATSLNDEATSLLSSANFSIEQAKIMLETARLIDDTIGQVRTPNARAATIYNLAYVYELEGNNQAAIQAYHDAIDINERDVLARYAYSSLVLISSSDNEEVEEAIRVAAQGQSYLPNNCQGAILLASNEANFDDKWNCFLLLTTEVGLRLKQENSTARPVLERAILLAENNQFFGSAYYVAEAYYYQAQLDGDAVSRDTLCGILLDYNSASPRHQAWADFAQEQLDLLYPQQTQCLALGD